MYCQFKCIKMQKSPKLQKLATKIDHIRIELCRLENLSIEEAEQFDMVDDLKRSIARTEKDLDKAYKALVNRRIVEGKLKVADFDFFSETIIDEDSLQDQIERELK